MNPCYEKKNWNKLPIELERGLLDYAKSASPINPHLPRNIFDLRKVLEVSFCFIECPDNVQKWIRANLPIDDSYYIFIAVQAQSQTPMHKDSIRTLTYNYLLTEGDCDTTFYDDSGVLIDTVRYKKSEWHMHNSAVNHSVNYISNSFRCAINVFQIFPDIKERASVQAQQFLDSIGYYRNKK